MSRIDDVFAMLRSHGGKALIPFVTAGDPDLDFTASVLSELDRHGASLCELGIPYSDPIADGPVIQASYTRALARGVRLEAILDAARRVAPSLRAPLVCMVSYAIIYRRGVDTFVRDAASAGFSGAIVPDLPVEESMPLAAACQSMDFSLIQLVAPTTPRERAIRIAERSTGFLYFVSVTGITGERRELPAELMQGLHWLRQRTPLPICVGFGISQAEHVRALAPLADGVIVGSSLVRRIAEVPRAGAPAALAEIGRFVDELVAALKIEEANENSKSR